MNREELRWLFHGQVHDRTENAIRAAAGLMFAAAALGILALLGIFVWVVVTT